MTKGKKELKVQMKSGIKIINFDFWSLEVIKEETGREILEIFQNDIVEHKDDIKNIKMTSLFIILYAAMYDEYDNKKDCIKDMKPGQFENYIEKIGDAVGFLFGE